MALTTTINLRNLDPDLIRRVKISAAKKDQKIREFVIEAIREAVKK